MDEKSNAIHEYIMDKNCVGCVHKNVCKHVTDFENAIRRVIIEAQASNWLIQYDIKCRFHKYSNGQTYKFQSVDGVVGSVRDEMS